MWLFRELLLELTAGVHDCVRSSGGRRSASFPLLVPEGGSSESFLSSPDGNRPGCSVRSDTSPCCNYRPCFSNSRQLQTFTLATMKGQEHVKPARANPRYSHQSPANSPDDHPALHHRVRFYRRCPGQ